MKPQSSTTTETSEDLKAREYNPVASKKNYENIWKMIYVGVSIAAAILMKKVYIFQTDPYFQNFRKGSFFDILIYTLPFAILFTIVDNGIHLFLDDIFLEYFINQQKYPDLEKRKKRCYTLAKWFFSILYYVPISVWAYSIFRETQFCPGFLGGNGNCLKLDVYVENFDEESTQMKILYLIQLGKHVSRFFSHVFIRSQGNFYEYALHHFLSTFLILFSFLMNYWVIGIMIMILHDWTDFKLILCRSYRDCKYRKKFILNILDVVFFPTWVAFRIFILSYCGVYSAFILSYKLVFKPEVFQDQKLVEIHSLPLTYMGVMLFLLLILQMFWTYYIGCSFISVNISKKVKHTYD